jgi:hypothetical protein
VQHRDQPRQVIGHQVGPDNAGLLTAVSEFVERLTRLPGLQIAVSPDELKFKDADIYGMKELPVTW